LERHLRLRDIGYDASRWQSEVAADGVVARVGADFGVEHRVVGEFGEERATLSGKVRFGDVARPAVGDFVVLNGAPGSRTIVGVLPRKSQLVRQAAGKKMSAQTIAANLDVVFVVTSFNEDFNFNRIARYLTAIRDGGALGVVVVNKSDLIDEPFQTELLAELKDRLGETPVVASSAVGDGELGELEPYLTKGDTASFVGSSGVGKSTIVNCLLGEQRQATAEVRETDAKGRHTTTHRELFLLPGGGIVIDTPGMREFQLWDEGEGLEVFEDIEDLAAVCRFRDCAHESEPGCAVRAAIEDGEITTARLSSWRKLRLEGETQRARGKGKPQ
jgi:ribosome biogenesis GTPase